jgi:hypothetical protein
MSGAQVDRRLSDRGTLVCRACGSTALASVLDLARQPLANELLPSSDTPDSTFPLHLRSCRACGLGQVGEFVLPDRMFSDYPYLSSVSTSWLEHARRYAERVRSELDLTAQDRVVEVASNDGYLLRQFLALGVGVLGVEPAANVAAVAEAQGVPTVVDFFGRETASRILAEHGVPRLVVANNVLAHVPDLDDFVGGLGSLCGDETVISVENPSYVGLLAQTQFDTIYHEHYSYLSAHAVQRLAAQRGLELIRVEELPTHGGSYRYWLARAGKRSVHPSVEASISKELTYGLLNPETWEGFATRSRDTIRGLRAWFDERRAAGARVAGYGAAAKGNTLLNAAGASSADLAAVVDGSVEKQGKWLPGSRVPVLAPAVLTELAPSDVLVLPWNLASEIRPLVAALAPDARCWTAVPAMAPIAP